MYRKNLFPGVLVALMLLVAFGFKVSNNPTNSAASETSEEVKAVIQNKCFGCHNTDSKNDKAKEKLDFKTLEALSGPDKVKAFREIADEVKDEEMPPKKFLERFPDKALTKDEHELLMSWAKEEAKNAMKK